MKKEQWLFAWVGSADLVAAGIRPAKGGSEPGDGPILAALKSSSHSFSKICLLNNYLKEEGKLFHKWIRSKTKQPLKSIELQHVELNSPVDYAAIYQAVCHALDQKGLPTEKVELTYHLSPGTPAMAAIWIMLAKTRYPAKLIQTLPPPNNTVESVDFPLDLASDFLPEYLVRNAKRIDLISEMAFQPETGFDGIIFQSAVIKREIDRARLIAAYDVPVLILGETGTGKELFAQAIHRVSNRSEKHIITVNCGAIPPELANSELFGYKKGSFTGALKDKDGYFQAANGSTLFLDEIGDLPLDSQVRLLRALQAKEITPVGATEPINVDVRIVAATHKDLLEEVAEGRFREDLFHRLAVGVLKLPPLRERGEDIHLLIDSFINQINEVSAGKPESIHKKISEKVRNILINHDWPGNIRQLYNVLIRASIWSRDATIDVSEIQDALDIGSAKPKVTTSVEIGQGIDLQGYLDEISKDAISQAMLRSGNQKKRAANLLGFANYQTLTNRMVALGMLDK
jgi:DNA-binding NtrC family response regulator